MMRDIDDLKDLKREYLTLVRLHGAEAAELESFRQSLLAMNRRHRLEAVRMYLNIISRIERKMRSRVTHAPTRVESRRRPRRA
jgi:hypothetical protein